LLVPNLEDNTVTVLAEAVLRDFKKQDQIGQFSALFQFGVDDLSHVVIGNAPNQIEIPAPLLRSLLSISVSTLRGLMFGAFKGTYLHGAILPLIDVGALQHELVEPFAN